MGRQNAIRVRSTRVGEGQTMRAKLRCWRDELKARVIDRLDLVLENVMLRQQLGMYERRDRSRGRTVPWARPIVLVPARSPVASLAGCTDGRAA